MRKRIIALVAMAFAAFGLLGSTAAFAGDVGAEKYESQYAVLHEMTHHDRECYGSENDWNGNVVGCVQPYGDVLWLIDTDSDASSVKMTWKVPAEDRSGECIDNEGYMDQTRCNKSFHDGNVVYWRLHWWEGGGWHSSDTYSTRI